ncbi:MAG: SDR family oxidoreductase [Hyphomicrobiaceae bacterium]|nr:SDR family oxidoreductase [Hyphomicrobiaceae bacterium]
MLMSVAELAREQAIYPELAGARVLITGVGSTCGVDLVRAFADHGCRLVLQVPDPTPEADALLGIVAETALDVRVHHDPVLQASEAIRFAQTAAKTFGGLDAVVNLISIERADIAGLGTLEEIEDMLSVRLQAAARATHVSANRMGLVWSNGSVLNVLRMPAPKTASEAAITGIARTALAAMTRQEAQRWAEQGIRINAIAPTVVGGVAARLYDERIRTEPEIAAVALYLASNEGAQLTGHILDFDTAAFEATSR